jgi:malonate transporter
MLAIFSITLPIYLLIALGYLSVRGGLFEKADMRIFGKLVMQICLPALLFRSLSSRPLDEIFNGTYLLAYGGGSLLMFALGRWAAGRWLNKNPQHSALFGLGMSGSNSGFMGYPIILQLLGPEVAVPFALTLVIENLVMLPLAITLIDTDGSDQASRMAELKAIFQRLVRNPVVMAIPLGVLFAALEWRLPGPVDKPIQLLAAVASPVALFVIGGVLVGLKVRGMGSQILVVSGAKLLGHPLAVGLMVLALPAMSPVMSLTAVCLAAMPMLSIYPVIAHRIGQEGFCAAALLLATSTSFVTISLALWVLHRVPAWAPAFLSHGH